VSDQEVHLIFSIRDDEDQFREADLPLAVWEALPVEWKTPDIGDTWYLTQISNRDTFGRIAILERANDTQKETIEKLLDSKNEWRQEEQALQDALKRKNDEINRLRLIRDRYDGMADALSKAGSDRDILIEQVGGMMRTLGISEGLDSDDMYIMKAMKESLKTAVSEVNDVIDTIESAE